MLSAWPKLCPVWSHNIYAGRIGRVRCETALRRASTGRPSPSRRCGPRRLDGVSSAGPRRPDDVSSVGFRVHRTIDRRRRTGTPVGRRRRRPRSHRARFRTSSVRRCRIRGRAVLTEIPNKNNVVIIFSPFTGSDRRYCLIIFMGLLTFFQLKIVSGCSSSRVRIGTYTWG